jgi:hypothetical protein
MNIVYLYPRKYYEKKMSRGRVWYGRAVQNRKDCTLKFWGPGWNGYDSNLPVQENLNRAELKPDVLWAYKPEECIGITERECPLVVCYNESWPHIPGKAAMEVALCSADLVICHHQNDKKCFDGCDSIVKSIPHCAPEFFAEESKPFDLRSHDFILSGVQSKEIYQLRHRYKMLADSGKIQDCHQLIHPGYRLQNASQCDEQSKTYAKSLGNSRVSLCCTSKYRYLLAKIVESMMAGCVVITDAADDDWFDAIRPYVICVDDNTRDEQIADMCKMIQNDKSRWRSFASEAQRYAKAHLSCSSYAERFIACLQDIV